MNAAPAHGSAPIAWLTEADLDALHAQWRAVRSFEALDESGGLAARYTQAWHCILRTYPELLEAARAGLAVQREAAGRAREGRRLYDASRGEPGAGADADAEAPPGANQEVSQCANQEVSQCANQEVSQ